MEKSPDRLLMWILVFILLSVAISASDDSIRIGGWQRGITGNGTPGNVTNNNTYIYNNITLDLKINFTNSTTNNGTQVENGSVWRWLGGDYMSVEKVGNIFTFDWLGLPLINALNKTIPKQINETSYSFNVSNGTAATSYEVKDGVTINFTGGNNISVSHTDGNFIFSWTGILQKFLGWWKFENNQFISPNQTDLVIVVPNGSVPYGNAYHPLSSPGISSGGTIINTSTSHILGKTQFDDLFVARGSTSSSAYVTPNNQDTPPVLTKVVYENVAGFRNNGKNGYTYLPNEKQTGFYGNETIAEWNALPPSVPPISWREEEWRYVGSAQVTFTRPYRVGEIPKVVITPENLDLFDEWGAAGGLISCHTYFVSWALFRITCIADGAAPPVSPPTIRVHWHSLGDEDNVGQQSGQTIVYLEGGTP